MRRLRPLTRQFLALLLSAALALPWAGPAYALRASSEPAHAGLEQALQSPVEHTGLEEPWVIVKKRRGSSVWFFGPPNPIAAAYTNELERVNRPTHPIQWELARIAPAFGVRVTVTGPSRRALLTMATLKQYERALKRRFDTTVAIRAMKPKRGADELFRQQVVLYGRVIVREMYVEEAETSKRIQDLCQALTGQLRRKDRTLSMPMIDRQLVVARLDGVRRVSPQRGRAAGMEEITEDALTQRFAAAAKKLDLPFDRQTPVYLWVGEHLWASSTVLGGRTVQQYDLVARDPALGLAQGGPQPAFLPLEIPRGRFEATLRALLRHPQVRGLNVTSPYKTEVARLADTLNIAMDDTARTIGVCSLLWRSAAPDGSWRGAIPDGTGFVQAYEPVLPDRTFADQRVVLFGAGGAGRAIAAALWLNERHRPASLTVVEPDETARRAVGEILARHPGQTRMAVDHTEVAEAIQNASVLINATELGKLDDRTPLADPTWFRAGQTVFDLNWWPTPRTRFLKEAAARGATVYNGMRMSSWLNAGHPAVWFGRLDSIGHIYGVMYRDAVQHGFQEAAPQENAVASAAGMEEGIVGELFGRLAGRDMSDRIQIIAPSVLKRDSYRFLAGFVGRDPFAMIPPLLQAELTTDEMLGDALVRATPNWARGGVFYGETAEYDAFVIGMVRAGRVIRVTHHSLDDRPDALTLLDQLLNGLGQGGTFEGRLHTLKDALSTLAQQY